MAEGGDRQGWEGPLVHHVELWTDDLPTAERQWGPVLAALGCAPFQHWENGRSWRRDGSYVVIEQSPDLRPGGHDRLRAGLNHLALRGPRRPVLTAALAAGWSVRTDTGHALHLTDGQGFELEVVYAPPAPRGRADPPPGTAGPNRLTGSAGSSAARTR